MGRKYNQKTFEREICDPHHWYCYVGTSYDIIRHGVYVETYNSEHVAVQKLKK